jgi:diguanylate cyclase (GGDEF)-like protein
MPEPQIDAMTGFLDRYSFLQLTAEMVALANESGESLSVFWIDLDRFKQVNGSFGYEGGDSIITVVADRLSSVINLQGHIGRVGADEFVCIVPELNLESAEQLASNLLHAVKPPLAMGDFKVRLTASIGIAIHELEENAAELLERADWAKITAKKLGGNRYIVSGNEVVPSHMGIIQAREDLEVEYLLHTALDHGGLQLHYQPILDFNGKVLSVEALMRCNVNGKSIPPGRFFPVAEKSELIARLGEWSLLEGARQARRLKDSGLLTTVSVNVSRAQLLDEKFSQDLQAAIEGADVAPGLIELELSESIFMDTSEVVQANLRAAREIGVKLAIDNFGTGVSCLANLKDIPTNKLKFGRSFITTQHQDKRSMSVVKAMIQMGKDLGMTVIAEGVETKEQMESLRELYVDGIQGYYYAKPMDVDSLSSWLKDREHA